MQGNGGGFLLHILGVSIPPGGSLVDFYEGVRTVLLHSLAKQGDYIHWKVSMLLFIVYHISVFFYEVVCYVLLHPLAKQADYIHRYCMSRK